MPPPSCSDPSSWVLTKVRLNCSHVVPSFYWVMWAPRAQKSQSLQADAIHQWWSSFYWWLNSNFYIYKKRNADPLLRSLITLATMTGIDNGRFYLLLRKHSWEVESIHSWNENNDEKKKTVNYEEQRFNSSITMRNIELNRTKVADTQTCSTKMLLRKCQRKMIHQYDTFLGPLSVLSEKALQDSYLIKQVLQ